MLRKIIILEIIITAVLGIYAYSVYKTYESAVNENQASQDKLTELRLEETKTQKEYEELDKELLSLRDSIDTKILEIWKRRVQDLQKELE